MTAHTHQNGPAGAADQTAGEKLFADWRKAVASETAALEANDAVPADADLQRAYMSAVEHRRQLARLAWTRILGPVDLRVRAEIVKHCLWANYFNSDGVPRYEAVLSGENAEKYLQLDAFDERAVAELVKAVLWTAGAAPADGRGAGDDPGHAGGLVQDLDEMLCKARQGVTALRTIMEGWERGHGPHKLFDDGDGAFLASLEFCADGIEATIDRMDERIDDAAEAGDAARRSPG